MNHKQEIFGLLHAWFETGTEGTWFTIYTGDFTVKDWKYENMTIVKSGDHLKILNKYCLYEILWEGVVAYHPTNYDTWVGKDNTITKEDWYKYFNDGYFGVLIRDIEEASVDKLENIK